MRTATEPKNRTDISARQSTLMSWGCDFGMEHGRRNRSMPPRDSACGFVCIDQVVGTWNMCLDDSGSRTRIMDHELGEWTTHGDSGSLTKCTRHEGYRDSSHRLIFPCIHLQNQSIWDCHLPQQRHSLPSPPLQQSKLTLPMKILDCSSYLAFPALAFVKRDNLNIPQCGIEQLRCVRNLN